MNLFYALLALCSASTLLVAETKAPPLSPLGTKQLEKNIAIIDGNITTIKQNLETITRNIGVIKGEILALNNLTKESATLEKTYDDYLLAAKRETEKNKLAKEKIKSWKSRTLASVGENNPVAKKSLSQADEELNNRLNWDKEAIEKVARAERLKASLTRSQEKMRIQKSKLRAELKNWGERYKEYNALLKRMQTQRASHNQWLKQSK